MQRKCLYQFGRTFTLLAIQLAYLYCTTVLEWSVLYIYIYISTINSIVERGRFVSRSCILCLCHITVKAACTQVKTHTQQTHA